MRANDGEGPCDARWLSSMTASDWLLTTHRPTDCVGVGVDENQNIPRLTEKKVLLSGPPFCNASELAEAFQLYLSESRGIVI